MAPLLGIPDLMTARALLERDSPVAPAEDPNQERGSNRRSRWSFEQLRGQLVELCAGDASAVLSFSARLIRQAQQADTPVAWVTAGESLFFAPDMLQNGVDLGSLAIVWPKDNLQVLRGADALLRSGGFGLLIVDLGEGAKISNSQQNRLARMAERHEATVVFLRGTLLGEARAPRNSASQRARPSTLRVSLRVEASRGRAASGNFYCLLRALKDNRRAPGWTDKEVRRGTPGLR